VREEESCAILLRMKKRWQFNQRQALILGGILIFFLVFGLGSASGYIFRLKQDKLSFLKPSQEDVYIRFLFEIYDQIQANYWDFVSDEQLSN